MSHTEMKLMIHEQGEEIVLEREDYLLTNKFSYVRATDGGKYVWVRWKSA